MDTPQESFWYAIGTGDSANPPVFAADSLGDYFAGLMTEAEAAAKLAAAP